MENRIFFFQFSISFSLLPAPVDPDNEIYKESQSKIIFRGFYEFGVVFIYILGEDRVD